MEAPLLCLASASPRRAALLAQIGVPYMVASAGVDEAARDGESAAEYVVRLAYEKAMAVSRQQELPVLGADTTVVIDELMLGKPRDAAEALAMLGRLSGREHRVLTAVALVDQQGVRQRLSASLVRFRPLSLAECEAYWRTGEPRDKAGGYAIQGRGAVFVESLHGSYSGVMGLPLYETAQLLHAAGIGYWRGGP